MTVSILCTLVFISGHSLSYPALSPGVPRWKSSQLATKIAARWKGLLKEAKLQATDDGVTELEGHREMKALSTRTVPIDAFHDARQTLLGIETEVCVPLPLTNNI